MAAATAASRLRGLLAGGGLVVAPGALEPFTARIIEQLGFPAVYLGGHSMGIHLVVGQPFLTLTETVDSAHRVLRAVEVPLIVDAGGGFGDPAHVHRTVRECERAGIAAIHLDDQPFPKRAAYHRGQTTIAPVDQVTAKLRAAVAARQDPDFLLVARTDALRATGSVEEAAERGHAFADAGADLLLVLDLEPGTLVANADRFPAVPLAWIGATSGPGPSLEELEDTGFRLALFPFNTAAAVLGAVTQTWQPLRDRHRLAQTSEVLEDAKREVLDLIGMATYWHIEEGS